MLRTAARQARAWQRAGLPPIGVAVNLSARQFRRKGVAKTVGAVLRDAGLEPRLFELEITESIVMHHTEAAIETLEALERDGRRARDRRLRHRLFEPRLPAGAFRCTSSRSTARSCTTSTPTPPTPPSSRRSSRSPAALGLSVVAEGVESEAQLAALRGFGVQAFQGFYFSQALPPEEFERLVSSASSARLRSSPPA